jgi:hypothetical protein
MMTGEIKNEMCDKLVIEFFTLVFISEGFRENNKLT